MRRVGRTTAVGIAVLLGCCAGAPLRGAEVPFDVIRNVVYAQPEGQPLYVDVYRPKGAGPFPGVLCVHGGAWAFGTKNEMAHIALALAAHGYTAVSIDYRLAPAHRFPAQIDDCRAALAWMVRESQTYHIDTRRIAAWGYSAGGQLVTLLGATNLPIEGESAGKPSAEAAVHLKAVVAGGAPCEFRDVPLDEKRLAFWLGGTRREKPEAYAAASPLKFAARGDPPMLFYHGAKDRLVDLAQPRKMIETLKAAGVATELYIVPDSGHVGAFFDRAAIDKGIAFLHKYL